MPDEEHTNDGPDAADDSKYFLLVGGLLLIICMALGWLWLKERSRRINAERQAAVIRQELDRAKAQVNALKGLGRKFILPATSQPAGRPRN